MALDAKTSWAGENILSIEQFGVESAKCVALRLLFTCSFTSAQTHLR